MLLSTEKIYETTLVPTITRVQLVVCVILLTLLNAVIDVWMVMRYLI